MSRLTIRRLLEQRFIEQLGDLPTSWENMPFSPPQGSPWQAVDVIIASTQQPTLGDDHYRVVGFLQVLLAYPTNTGVEAAMLRAEAVSEAFPRGMVLTSGGVSVLIDSTAEITRGRVLSGLFQLPVNVPFTADVNV